MGLRMLRGLYVMSFVLLCVCALNVSATKLNYHPKVPTISDKKHYKDEEHNLEYDHEVFLGRDLSSEWRDLPADEVMEKLSELFPKIDTDRDKKISVPELYEWIEQHMKKHSLRQADIKMRDIDTNKDGKVSWKEYIETQYPSSIEKGLNEKGLGEFRELVSREKKRFDFADTDNDKELSREEFSLFLHPGESKRMSTYLIEESLDIFDTNKDGKISADEYIGDDAARLVETNVEVLKKSFSRELDSDKDGFLDRSEIRAWIIPGVNGDPILVEAKHLMKAGDDDKDKFLTEGELIKHYDIFAGSRVTRYGDLLKEEL